MSTLNPFKQKRKQLPLKKTNLRKPFIQISSDKPNCWISYCEYGKVCITNSEEMLRLTVSKKGDTAVQHLTCKFDKNKNFRVYYSNKKGVVDVAYQYSREFSSFISQMLNSVTNLKTCQANLKAGLDSSRPDDSPYETVKKEYSKRFYQIFGYGEPKYSRDYNYRDWQDATAKLIYPLNDDKKGLNEKPPVCFRRSIRKRDPKKFVHKFFGRSPKSLTKAVVSQMPLNEKFINNMFLAKTFFAIWPLDKIVEFINLSKESPQKPFIYCSDGYSLPLEVNEIAKINIWRNFFRRFSYEKVLNWYKKYPQQFGHYTRDTVRQLEELRLRGITVDIPRKMDLKQVHDLVSRIFGSLKREEFALPVYDILEGINHTKVGGYELVFPKTNHDMMDWGEHMHICVGSYDSFVKKGSSVIFTLQENGLPIYCVEFLFDKSGRRDYFSLNQCHMRRNRKSPDSIKDLCKKTIKKVVESASKNGIIKKPKLIYPEDHKITDITQHIDLGALEQIQKIETPVPQLPRYGPDAHVVVPAADVIIDNDLDF